MKTIWVCDLQFNEMEENKKIFSKVSKLLAVGVRKAYYPGKNCEIPYVIVEDQDEEPEECEFEFKFLKNGDSVEDGYAYLGTITLDNGTEVVNIFYRKA